MKEVNPFIIAGYKGPAYFCDRENETKSLEDALINGRNMTLFSPRRLGKTGLIHHFFHSLKDQQLNTIYADIYGTEDLNGFINRLANAVLQATVSRRDTFIKKTVEMFRRIHPKITFNELTGLPEISLQLNDEAERQATLKELFEVLEKQKQPNFLALDEFQQISQYPEKNTEELLRAHIQQLKNTRFIFSGSQRHLLVPMFSDAKRPFYQSTGFLPLERIDRDEYAAFISENFSKNKQAINGDAVSFILEWTKSYTFYTQYLCNVIFSKKRNNVTEPLVRECILEIFTEREPVFYNYRKLLSHHQFLLLSAIGMEDLVTEPTGQDFLKKYDLSNASTVRKSLHALIEKEMVYEHTGKGKTQYQVYDVFLSRWFQWKGK